MTSDEAKELFLRQLPLIEKIIGAACRRAGFERTEAEDLAGALRLKLIENDYRAIREFGEKSSFATYITVIAQRFLIDHRNHVWGRWRPSAEAVRLGECAVQLETLLQRDGRTFDEACRILASDPRFSATRAELDALFQRLPSRLPRATTQSIEETGAAAWLASSESPHERLVEQERQRLGAVASEKINAAVRRLDPEDRLLLRMRFGDEMSVAQIARATGQDQRQLYYRLERMVGALRKALRDAGVDRDQIEELLRDGAASLSVSLLGNRSSEPSNDSGGATARELRAE